MKRRVIAFDLDNTLAESKSPITVEMSGLLDRLLARFQVCVISGGKFEQFETQLIDHLHVAPARLCALHVMPTCGTRYYRFDLAAGAWRQVYAEDIPADKRAKIAAALAKGAAALGFREAKLWGEQIEDRGSQVTFSALGQEARRWPARKPGIRTARRSGSCATTSPPSCPSSRFGSAAPRRST